MMTSKPRFGAFLLVPLGVTIAAPALAAAPDPQTLLTFEESTTDMVDGPADEGVTLYGYQDQVGISLPEDLQCPALTLWFDGECRTAPQLEQMLGAPSTHIVGSQLASGSGAVIINEPLSTTQFRRTIVSDAQYPPEIPVARRGIYTVEAVLEQTIQVEDPFTYTVYLETFLPEPLGSGLTLETWSSATYSRLTPDNFCHDGQCFSGFSPQPTCEAIEVAVQASGHGHCESSLDFFSEALGYSLAWPGAITVRRIPGSESWSSSGTTVGATSAIGQVLYPALTCADKVRDVRFMNRVAMNCYDPTGPLFDGEGDLSLGASGCQSCDEWGKETVTITAIKDGKLVQYTQEVLGCAEWSWDDGGTDSDGDGWCD